MNPATTVLHDGSLPRFGFLQSSLENLQLSRSINLSVVTSGPTFPAFNELSLGVPTLDLMLLHDQVLLNDA